jgi:3',5'-cyclic-AMP phosphodiesterase
VAEQASGDDLTGGPVTIAHISDLHAGSPYFVPSLMDRTVIEINELKPDLVLCTGDLTEMGFRQDYLLAREYLERIECPDLVVVPGNHDARNVGYVHFEELIGPRSRSVRHADIQIVAVDSSEPDLDVGQIGRARYEWLLDEFSRPARLKILMLHHHLLPIPGTGRERNMVYDAGDVLEVLQQAGVNLVLSGHKHVPYAWRLERVFVVNAGTACSLRLRGTTRPCYNIITLDGDYVRVVRKYPFHGTETLIEFEPSTASFEKYTCLLVAEEER